MSKPRPMPGFNMLELIDLMIKRIEKIQAGPNAHQANEEALRGLNIAKFALEEGDEE